MTTHVQIHLIPISLCINFKNSILNFHMYLKRNYILNKMYDNRCDIVKLIFSMYDQPLEIDCLSPAVSDLIFHGLKKNRLANYYAYT